MIAIWDPAAFAQGFWQGVFELLALAIIAASDTFIFQRRQARYTLREGLIDSINSSPSAYTSRANSTRRSSIRAAIRWPTSPTRRIARPGELETIYPRWKTWSPLRVNSASCRSS